MKIVYDIVYPDEENKEHFHKKDISTLKEAEEEGRKFEAITGSVIINSLYNTPRWVVRSRKVPRK